MDVAPWRTILVYSNIDFITANIDKRKGGLQGQPRRLDNVK